MHFVRHKAMRNKMAEPTRYGARSGENVDIDARGARSVRAIGRLFSTVVIPKVGATALQGKLEQSTMAEKKENRKITKKRSF